MKTLPKLKLVRLPQTTAERGRRSPTATPDPEWMWEDQGNRKERRKAAALQRKKKTA